MAGVVQDSWSCFFVSFFIFTLSLSFRLPPPPSVPFQESCYLFRCFLFQTPSEFFWLPLEIRGNSLPPLRRADVRMAVKDSFLLFFEIIEALSHFLRVLYHSLSLFPLHSAFICCSYIMRNHRQRDPYFSFCYFSQLFAPIHADIGLKCEASSNFRAI